MKNTDFAGIDVSAKELVVAIKRGQRAPRLLTFHNNPAGHRKLVRFLTKGGRHARICLESTGVYSLDPALALHRSAGIDVMLANPRAVRDFAKARFQRSKTDTADAIIILEFVQRMPFVPWQPPAQEVLDLRAIARRIAALTVSSTREKNRLHAARGAAELTNAIALDIQAHIQYIKTSVEELTFEAIGIIQENPDLLAKFKHLISIKGIADASAVAILAELAVLPEDMSPREWVAHAGLDPRKYESGSSIHKPARISKTGNRRIRAALFMPAMVAARHDPHVSAFYQKLIRRGKKPLQANVAVMRKLLHAIHGMFHNDQDFDGERFYALTA